MKHNAHNSDTGRGATARKPYAKPVLTRHGSVASLTKAFLLRVKVVGDKDASRSNPNQF
jgi:hypothetical protein